MQPEAGKATRHGKLEPGRTLGAFHLVERLGGGALGEVWASEHIEPGRRVALKVLTGLADLPREARSRFEQLGRRAARLDHPHCLKTLGAHDLDGVPAIAFELAPHGTLRDRLDASGPLPRWAAVDAVLDALAGLEAAGREGLLHGDIRPENLFLDSAGRVRVGDFAIWKDLLQELESEPDLTELGAEYWGPEVLDGGSFGVRSEMYSLGATLHALLAGRPPFAGRRGDDLRRAVATEEPPSLRDDGVRVPKALQRVVSQLLAKDPNARPATHAELRNRLLPFSARRLEPAPLSRRSAAFALDVLLLVAASVSAHAVIGSSLPPLPVPTRMVVIAATLLVVFGPAWAITGSSIAKRLLRLRLTTRDGARVSPLRAVLRGLVLSAPPLLLATAAEMAGPALPLPGPAAAWGAGVGLALMASTMRRSNGWAGLHELSTGTRVKALPAARSGDVQTSARSRHADDQMDDSPSAGSMRGPFRVKRELWAREGERLLLGADDVLERRAWIYEDDDEEASGERWLALAGGERSGRLHWLQGGRRDESAWDAFEAPDGTSVLEHVRRTGPLGWSRAREILLAVARELESGHENGDLPPTLSLRQLWLAPSGLVLLDVPSTLDGEPGSEAAGTPDLPAGKWQRLLHQLVLLLLEGRVVPESELDGVLPARTLPEHARVLVERIADHDSDADLWDLLERLDDAQGQPTRARRRWRLPTLVLSWRCLATAVVAALLGAWLWAAGPRDVETIVMDDRPDVSTSTWSRWERWAKEVVLARAHERWRQLPVTYPFFEPDRIARLDALAGAHRGESERARDRAQRLLAQARWPVPVERAWLEMLGAALRPLVMVLAAWFPIALLLCLTFRGSPLLWMSGLAVQRTNGRRAGRLRCAVREVAAWAPILLAAAFVAGPGLVEAAGAAGWSLDAWSAVDPWRVATRSWSTWSTWLGAGTLLVLPALLVVQVLAAVHAFLDPAAGWAEKLSGTRLVPR